MNSLPAGWARPLVARKHHFFKTGENISICGRWLYLAHNREPDTFESPDDCAECRRRLNKEKDNGQ
ncbi:TPA: hypothetical protein RXP54_003056 [Escherichia coli]|nr:hypothetical protein [Escherichia coli]HDX3891242.1 hypothetical protein [Escherichia coli]HEA8608946.1 hypothetical protein [Escherichia coli]HEA8657583.1 hypothetical protein [Escherichia coli]HEA8677738.1 hypothetical protein [Escherichia coli]